MSVGLLVLLKSLDSILGFLLYFMKKISWQSLDKIDSLKNFFKNLGKSRSLLKKHLTNAQLNKSFMARELIHLPLNLVNDGYINPCYTGDEVEILYEDENFIALNKPHNLHIHPLSYDESDNLLSFLRANSHFAALKVNSSHYDRGLLYRLDYCTSGVVVLSKKENIYQEIRASFNSLVKIKKYYCMVEGPCSLKLGEYTHYFSGDTTQKVSANNNPQWHKGELSIKNISLHNNNKISLVEIDLKTGLRHQIRAQMAYLGYPIIGDLKYGGIPHDRVMLHAESYEMIFENKSFLFKSPIKLLKYFS